jgi:Zn-dependent peptidase ImmA (M78 family)
MRPLDSVLDDLANEFDVSNQAMRYRLVNLGLIDPT